ncbi:MAG TPA: hypothetical protein VF015_05525 [Acidimicrobiales bacterium]
MATVEPVDRLMPTVPSDAVDPFRDEALADRTGRWGHQPVPAALRA